MATSLVTATKTCPSSLTQNSRTRFSSSSSSSSSPVVISTTTTRRKQNRTNSCRIFCSFNSKSFDSFKSYDHIPKQFREENLKDGLMENYKSLPKHLYGLTPSQMNLFTSEDSPLHRQSESVTEESISSARSYMEHTGMYELKGMSGTSMSSTMYRGGARGGYGRLRSSPPDLPSLLLDARIVVLGMPIVPEVTELLVAQFLWLDFDDTSKPIYLYIHSSGTQNEDMENVGSETDAYAIADCMNYCKANVYTVNMSMAYGQAAMLLSLGTKGYRALQPNSFTKLYLPKVFRSSGAASDMWIKAKELDANTDYYIELVAKGTGKSKEEIAKDLQHSKFLLPQEAIDYGVADKIIDSRDAMFDKKDYDAQLAKSRTMRNLPGAGAQAAPSGFS